MARPSKYKKGYGEVLIETFKKGGDTGYFMAAVGISKKTFYNWLEAYPEFREAYEIAKPMGYVFDSEVLKAGAVGEIDKFNATAWMARMNSRHEDFGFSRNPEKAGVQINIDKMLNYNSSEGLKALDAKISELLDQQPELKNLVQDGDIIEHESE